MKDKYFDDKPIFALATPFAVSALAVIRMSGEGTIALLSKCFTNSKKLQTASSNSLIHGFFHAEGSSEDIDEVMVAVFRKGSGYTGEEAAELYVHGNPVGITAIMEALSKAGFRAAAPGEFTFRAFRNGRMDLTRAEAVEELVSSSTLKGQTLALKRLRGALEERINSFREELLEIYAPFELQLDYDESERDEVLDFPAEKISKLEKEIEDLLSTYRAGRLYSAGATVALAGPANAGKSTLFNLLLKEDRSIVSPVPGTTRDYIEKTLDISGIPVRLYDTAGFNNPGSAIEEEGIRRTEAILEAADLIILLSEDGSADPGNYNEKTIRVRSKADLTSEAKEPLGKDEIAISSLTGEGVEKLLSKISDRLKAGVPMAESELVIENQGQKEALERTLTHLRAVNPDDGIEEQSFELYAALRELGSITEFVGSEEILDRIFSRFCVGK